MFTRKMFQNRGAITEEAVCSAHCFATGITKLVLPQECVLISPAAYLLTVSSLKCTGERAPPQICTHTTKSCKQSFQ